MARKYKFTINKLEEINGFDYEGTRYNPGDDSPLLDACEMKEFLQVFSTANPNYSINPKSTNYTVPLTDFIALLDDECQAVVNPIQPQPAPLTDPSEVQPLPLEGDSADLQDAPAPPVGGEVLEETDYTEEIRTPYIEEEPTRPPEGKPHPTKQKEKPQNQIDAGDPLDIFSGAFYIVETDLEIPHAILPLSFSRIYQSGGAAFGPLGWNWDHNFNLYIRELHTGDIALWRNLNEEIFKFDGTNFEPQRGVFEKLERVAGLAQAYELISAGGTKMRFERPRVWNDGERIPIILIEDRHGNRIFFTYGQEDNLLEVRDGDDRFFKFEYDKCGLLVSVFDHADRRFEYEHNEETFHLTCVKTPPITDHPNGVSRIYHYENHYVLPELRHNIVRIEDSDGNVYLENTYDQDPASWSYSRVTEQLYGGFLSQYKYTQLQWVPPNPLYLNIPYSRVEVMNPDYSLETYTFNYRGDLLDRRYRLNKDGSFRVVVWQYEFDEQGNLSKTTYPDGSEDINSFDFSNIDPRMRGNLLKKELRSATGFPSPSRIVWRGKYEPFYQLLIEERNELNAVTEYKYDFDLNPGSIDNTGKLLEIHNPDATLPDNTMQSSVLKYKYNDRGQPTFIIEANGVTHENIYGSNDNEKNILIKQIFDKHSLNIENSYKYNDYGFEVEKIDGNGNTTKRIVNHLGLIEKTILPPISGVEAEFQFRYNSDKKLVSNFRPKGNYSDSSMTDDHIIDEIEYDVLGYPTKYIFSSNTSENRTVEICNDFRGLPVETINPDGSKILREFDERGLLLNEEILGRDNTKLTSKRVYDRSGRLIQQTDSNKQTIRFKYDGFSRISKVMLPNGTEINKKWIKGDLLDSVETIGADGAGNIRQLSFVKFNYDEKGRRNNTSIKAFETEPLVANDITIKYFYDKLDRIEKIIDNRGGTISYKYDGLGRLINEADTMGNEKHFVYDNNSNVIEQQNHHKEPGGTSSVFRTSLKYDSRDRMTEIIEIDGPKNLYEYDDRNLLVRNTDYLGIISEAKYNSFKQKTQEIHDVGGLNIVHGWAYDNMSRVTSYIDPTGQTSDYHTDDVGRLYKTEYPNGFSSEKIFNNYNQVVKEQLGSGVEFKYTYDSSNRVVKIENTAVPPSIGHLKPHEFRYDGLNRTISAKVGANEVIRKYDSQNRILSETTLGDTIQCKYNDLNGEVEKKWPDGRTEKYSHNLNGVLTKIEEVASGTFGNGSSTIASFNISGSNNLGNATYQGNLNIENKFDQRKRLVEIELQSPSGINEQIKYRYDSANRKRVEAYLGQNTNINFYEFDNRNRLTSAKEGFSSTIPDVRTQAENNRAINIVRTASSSATYIEEFHYNAVDARTKYTESGGPDKNYQYSPGHKIKSNGSNTYNYHPDGTMQTDGSFTFETDTLGRVVKIIKGNVAVYEFEYDALNRPSIIKEFGKPKKSFNYLGAFIEQEKENDAVSKQLTLHPFTGVPIAYHTPSTTYYTLFDERFNLVGLTDSSGNLKESYRYKPFGSPEIYNSLGVKIPYSEFGISPIFGGQTYLPSADLYIAKKRIMDPKIGAFLSMDSLGYKDSSSLYVYAAQDPINKIDPNGQAVPTIVSVFVIGGALAGFGFSIYDEYEHPGTYEGLEGTGRVLVNTFGGAVIAGAALVGGELILAAGGTGLFASGAGASLTASQTFGYYGLSSLASGAITRGGFNFLFPDYVDQVSAQSLSTDLVAGGALGYTFRGLTYLTNNTNFANFPSLSFNSKYPLLQKTGDSFLQWLRFGTASGWSGVKAPLGPYPGKSGDLLYKMKIQQGYDSTIINYSELKNNPFDITDTKWHEGFHAFVSKYLPTYREKTSGFLPTNAHTVNSELLVYPEEVIAYAIGHLAAKRFHAIPFAPFEAFRSVRSYPDATKLFWGRIAGSSGVLASEQLTSGINTHPNEVNSSSK